MKEVFSKIAVLQYAAEAQGITGRLKAEGIETLLADIHSIDTDPLMSNAIGGIKLNVRWEDRNRALQVYESTSKYYVDDEGRSPASNVNVKKWKVLPVSLVLNPFSSFASFFNFLPMHIRREYPCVTCIYKFKLK